MKLSELQVENFRSVNDSGLIEVRQQTALVGRNESGKTNLLLALASLNPPSRKLEVLSFIKDFPRDRPKTAFSEDLVVVRTVWELSEVEQQELGDIFPRAKNVTKVNIGRYYKAQRFVGFEKLPPLIVNTEEMAQKASSLRQSLRSTTRTKHDVREQALSSLETFLGVLTTSHRDPVQWAEQVLANVANLEKRLAELGVNYTDAFDGILVSISTIARNVQNDGKAGVEARNWIANRMPIFVYLDEFPELRGHQSIPEFLEAKRLNNLGEAERNFAKLMKVAGLDPQELQSLLTTNHEERQQLTNRAGAVVTGTIRKLWTDRKLKIRFHPDAEHFDTLVSDSTSVYDVEINMDERSRGFKWFFSFYITFAADTAGGFAQDAILLLDEPGLYLHAKGQQDLLKHFRNDFKNQIIFTTHSPFMIPIDNIASVKTVNIEPETGTVVSNDPTGDEKTLFPLQTALGYEITQSLFVGERNLVVEGITDFWYLSSLSEYFKDAQGNSLDVTITPVGGAQKISYMVSLLTAHNLKVLVLFDAEREGRAAASDLIKSKLIRDENVIYVTEGLGTISTKEADIEDLLDPQVYEALVNESYKKELQGKKLVLNSQTPRIVRRYEEAFESIDLVFNKTRPAKLFLRRIGDSPTSVITPTVQENFARLFGAINLRLEKLMAADRHPFK